MSVDISEDGPYMKSFFYYHKADIDELYEDRPCTSSSLIVLWVDKGSVIG